MAAKKLVIARENFSCAIGGKEVLIYVGTVASAGDELVKGRELLFEPYPAKPQAAG